MVAYITDPALRKITGREGNDGAGSSEEFQGGRRQTFFDMRLSIKLPAEGFRWKFFRRFFEKFWLGGTTPQTPPLNGRSSHLIEAAKRRRLDQIIFFFGAADDTRAADDRPAGRPARRLAG